jgi:hypothetical protein
MDVAERVARWVRGASWTASASYGAIHTLSTTLAELSRWISLSRHRVHGRSHVVNDDLSSRFRADRVRGHNGEWIIGWHCGWYECGRDGAELSSVNLIDHPLGS